jgi:ABC-type Fe3+-hydroxamate transport system substrate-binding protein
MGVQTIMLDFQNLATVMASIQVLGSVTAAEAQAGRLIGDLVAEIVFAQNTSHLSGYGYRPRMLIILERPLDRGLGGRFIISGRVGYFQECLDLAGWDNAYSSDFPFFPAISFEEAIRMRPDAVLEISADPEQARQRLRDWAKQKFLKTQVSSSYLMAWRQPGPSMGEALRELVTLRRQWEENRE